MLWPDWLEEVKAKSADRSAGDEAESLARHTWLVLKQLAALARERPALPETLPCPDLWHRMFWACLLHDLGKAARGFQEQLISRSAPRWHHRHEVLSLAFVDWVLPPGTDDEARLWVVAAIASHHRDADDMSICDYMARPGDYDPIPELLADIPDASIRGIHRWVAGCAPSWIEALNLPGVRMLPLPVNADAALDAFRRNGAGGVQRALRAYRQWALQLDRKSSAARIGGVILRGLLTTADHVGSAHVEAPPPADLGAGAVIEGICRTNKKITSIDDLYDHQRDWTPGSAILTAPTGSGKTEAALLWAAAQSGPDSPLPRLFYTLPYQASMNAMQHRLGALFGEESVTVEHGRALLALYRLAATEGGYDPHSAAAAARRQRNLARLHLYPVKVFSPYQMLKAVYRLRGYEGMLLDYYGGAFVFDEIHAYEPAHMALILSTIAYLRQHYAARFLVMTATLPPLLKDKIKEALGDDCAEVRATDELFQQFRRHCLRLLPGEVLNGPGLVRIAQDVEAGKSVLVCCNTVARAQEAYHALKALLRDLPAERAMLLHGRFNGRDRLTKEANIQQAVGSRSDARHPLLLVATQVVEVSLDIDLDTIYTDPAPLEALLQRFGRVNRGRLRDLADVHVFAEPADGQHIYDENMVARTLDILNREAGRPIDEAAVSDWLGEIYSGEVADKWLREYDYHANEFQSAVLGTLTPFASNEELTEQFYRAFDSVEVLPEQLYDDYINLKDDEPIRASELLVPISWGRYMGLLGKGQAKPGDRDTPKTVNAAYSFEMGLQYLREEQPADWGEG